jgi:hypothetical protein
MRLVMHPIKSAFAIGATMLGMACASAPAPTEQLASAEASVRAAHELGAESVPRAELHVELAKEQVIQARKLAEDGENERAQIVLTRARADAELALALTREATAHKDLQSATSQTRSTSMIAPAASTTPTTTTSTVSVAR